MFEAESHSANLVGQRLQGVGRGLCGSRRPDPEQCRRGSLARLQRAGRTFLRWSSTSDKRLHVLHGNVRQ